MSERETSAPRLQHANSRLALYRKYRSQSLDEIIGQPQVTDVLKAVAATKNFAHAYLLTGQRGTGKTSVARILAHLINETSYDTNEKDADLDIIEIDAASRGSVDDARELREKSAIAPIRAKHKIYIIDEVHMLSTPAFNALLKIIEEPPEHIVFILATTELQKVPATILSRVQRFHFRPVPAEIVAEHLRQISDKEKIAIDDEALLLIAQRGGGSLRDAISLLDQLSGSDFAITRQKVEEILGLAPETEINKIIENLRGESSAESVEIVTTLQKLFADGISPSLIVNQLIDVLENLAPTNPELYELIEKLLDVAKSAVPDVKLAAILMQFATRNNVKSSSSSLTRGSSDKNNKVVAQAATAAREEEKLAQIIEKNIAEEKASASLPETLSSIASDRTFARSAKDGKESSDAKDSEPRDRLCERQKAERGLSVTTGETSESSGQNSEAERGKPYAAGIPDLPDKPSSSRKNEQVNSSLDSSVYQVRNDAANVSESDQHDNTKDSSSALGISQPIQDNPSQVQENFPTYNKNLPNEISWPDVLDQIQKSDQPAMLATAKFAEHVYQNGQITLYFAKTFHRKKADSAKFRGSVADAAKKLYDCDIEIAIAKSTVPEDSDAAKILDIMGGGEVVSHVKA